MIKMNKMLVICWADARIFQGMHKRDEALKLEMEIFNSIGYLVEENDTVTKIAHEITNNGEYRDILLIPTGTIIAIQELVPLPQCKTGKK